MMNNVEYTVRGNVLIIEVDLSSQGTETGRGNTLVATTGNWTPIPELGKGWSMNMVVVRKAGAQVPAHAGRGMHAVA